MGVEVVKLRRGEGLENNACHFCIAGGVFSAALLGPVCLEKIQLLN